MRSREPVFEKSRSVQDMHHMRLMTLLSELVRDKGVMRAAAALDVDHRTLTASMERGRLSRRMRNALDKALLEGLVKAVDGKVESLGKDLSKGLSAVQGDVKALRDEHGRRLAQLESDRTGEAVADGKEGAAGKPRARASLRREFPDLISQPVGPGGRGGGCPVVSGPGWERSPPHFVAALKRGGP